MIVAYLTFNGQTEEAFAFYRSVLGGEFKTISRFADTPHAPHMPESDRQKIMHITLEAPDGITLMGNDHLEMMGKPYVPGNNFSLSLHPANKDMAQKFFNGLSAGGTVIMPLDKTFWGAYFGMFTDKFGVQWVVNCEDK